MLTARVQKNYIKDRETKVAVARYLIFDYEFFEFYLANNCYTHLIIIVIDTVLFSKGFTSHFNFTESAECNYYNMHVFSRIISDCSNIEHYYARRIRLNIKYGVP